MRDLGIFQSLGALWLRTLAELESKGAEAIYTDNVGEQAEVKELFDLSAEVQNAALPDEIIERHKNQEEYDWMLRNFTVQGKVPELRHENSYASRLYSYMGRKNQVDWLVDRLRRNPCTRSATITMFEPLMDEGYIPCVSLLDFQQSDGQLNMTAYCRALDFGCKAYVNLVMLRLIQSDIAEKVGMSCGKLTLLVKSAHFYLRDRDKVMKILREEQEL